MIQRTKTSKKIKLNPWRSHSQALVLMSNHLKQNMRSHLSLIFIHGDDDSEYMMSAQDQLHLMMLEKWDKELAEKGMEVTKFERGNWQGKCGACGEVDMHPTRDCPYADFIFV